MLFQPKQSPFVFQQDDTFPHARESRHAELAQAASELLLRRMIGLNYHVWTLEHAPCWKSTMDSSRSLKQLMS